MQWVPVSRGRSGIHAKLISSGQKEKDKHWFEGRPPLTLLKKIPAPDKPFSITLCSNAQFALCPKRVSGHTAGHPADPNPNPCPRAAQGGACRPGDGGPGSVRLCSKLTLGTWAWGGQPLCGQSLSKGHPEHKGAGAGREPPKLWVCSQSRKTYTLLITFTSQLNLLILGFYKR